VVLDTPEMVVVGEGQVDLKTEKIDFSMNKIPKGGIGIGGIRLGASNLAVPLKISGTLGDPALTVNPEAAALTSTPVKERPEKGLKIQLTSKRIGGIKSDTPILYRDLVIGRVYDYRLAETSAFVRIFVNIKEPYRNLNRQNSIFWNSGGFDLNISLLGAKITSESLKGILTGGISVATPDKPGDEVKDGKIFRLHEEKEKEWLEWAPRIDIHPDEVETKGKDESQAKEGISVKGLLK